MTLSSSEPALAAGRCFTSWREPAGGCSSSSADRFCREKRRTGIPAPRFIPRGISDPRSGSTGMAVSCGPAWLISSEATPSCMAPRCSGSANVTFDAVRHVGGISPEWPLKYRDWESYYSRAERLYQVHGSTGEDPTEPWRREPFPWPAVSHEPRIAEISEALRARGLHPRPHSAGHSAR
jgi:hypothetical protein